MVTQGEVNKKIQEKITEVEKKREGETNELKTHYDKQIFDLKELMEAQRIQHEQWMEKNMEDLKEEYDTMLEQAKLEMEEKTTNQIEVLMKVIDRKDVQIAGLNQDIGSLTEKITSLQSVNSEHTKKLIQQERKCVDLEDRSRRHNILFYGIPEKEGETDADCEKTIESVIETNNLLNKNPDNPDYPTCIDRAHRLGRKVDGQIKPRPMIAKFTFYKDKETVCKNGRKLKSTKISMSQDYSKATSELNKQLYNAARTAQNNCEDIKRFYVNYRYVTIFYDIRGKFVRRNFNLDNVNQNPQTWFKLQNF